MNIKLMNIKLRTVGDITILDLSGKLTLGEGTAVLRNVVNELLDKGRKKIILNFGCGEMSYFIEKQKTPSRGFSTSHEAGAYALRFLPFLAFFFFLAICARPFC